MHVINVSSPRIRVKIHRVNLVSEEANCCFCFCSLTNLLYHIIKVKLNVGDLL